MNTRIAAGIVLVVLAVFTLFATAKDEVVDLLESNKKAIQLLEQSLKAYGGATAEENLKLAITVQSDYTNEGQSLHPNPPFETYPLQIELKMDQKERRLSSSTSSSIAGDFVFKDHTFLVNGKGFSINPHTKSFREVENDPWVVRFLLPHRTIQQALQNKTSLRMLSESSVSFATPTGQMIQLSLDPQSNLLSTSSQIIPMGVYGDGFRKLEFSDYRKAGPLMIPGKLTMRNRNEVNGWVQNQYTFEKVSTEFEFDPKEFEVPSDCKKEDYTYRKSFGVEELAKDIYLFENISGETGQWSYNVLFVNFNDYAVLAEAPVNSAISESVLKKVRELAPGKPVQYLIQSHHHSDHLGGIRPYIAEQTTILTGSSTIPLIEKIAAAPFQLNPDRLFLNPAKPKMEPVNGKRSIRDANHEVIVYDIGPSPHAEQMLITYLPSEKILYQSDMINEGEYPENDTTRHFEKKLQELRIDPKIVVGLHGKVKRK